MKCGWCITSDHELCKPWVFYEGTFWFCNCDCKEQEERDAIRESDDVRSRLEEWKAQESRLDNKRTRRTKRGIQGRQPESKAAPSVQTSAPTRTNGRRGVRGGRTPADILLLEAVRRTP